MDKRIQAVSGLVITFVVAVCWKNDFIRFLLGFEILTLLVLFLEVRYLRKKVELDIKLPETIVTKEEQFPVQVHAVNKARIPISRLRVQIKIYDPWARKDLWASGVVMLDGKETGVLQLLFSPGYSGVYEVRASSYRVWDHLGIFSARRRLNLHERTLHVLPAETMSGIMDVVLGQDEPDGDQSVFKTDQSAVDLSEIREYREGDDIRHIHWKLSAKSLDLLVREMGEPLEKMNQIYLNLQYGSRNLPREKWEDFLSVVARVSGKLLNTGHSHRVFWIDIEIRKIVEYRVKDEAGLQDLLCGLLHAHYWVEGEVSDILEEIHWNETTEEVIEINLEGDIISAGFQR